ncbi:PAP/fibrillin family protein [Dolichospermum circinale CS-1225]|uniref:PAP/fibrillin family protein n=1 Tax=Dolichospermum circinale CS-537/01 TaxID=3021739 RepID=A0ABT5A580_9CYAN|nr:PAP/fibrillin family protein [Dolichospermum circinale]MDB9460252.1 PAP/fibrillin family protein [Dolichospermum circinale CS-545/17]MDB9467923.1 PAP/fibrillin family protein [Dolichospermum circinale CS-539/09]MDB9469266.1 PAP/fibrillin family protein [Dolichospermum circinale CS-539]MDB9487089.1 PAP/fibrillin family protein [Dolichospermum circinale CS-537/01]MDB9521863.1 PAP/fibrillin family protein [Dolichospermum circinale CS-1225]
MIGKSNLIDIVAGTNRGLLVNAAQQQAILAAIANLEDFNPTLRPLASNLLEGDWRLLYTTSKALLNIDRLPFFQLGQIYQCIRVETNSVYNIAEIYGIPALEGLVSVVAKFTPLSPSRLQVKFQRSIIGLQRLIGYTTPGNFVQEIESGHFQNKLAFDFPIQSQQQQGWLDITYLDDDLRIARGNEGSVFVLSKT